MVKYTFMDKKQYVVENIDSVSLLEHAIIKDTNEKFVLLKFINNHTKTLKVLEIEITQLNYDNKQIMKSVYKYNVLNAKSKKIFIPPSKIKLKDNCNKIECKILQVHFYEMDQNNEINIKKDMFQSKIHHIKEIKVGKRYSSIILPIFLSFLLIYLISVNFNSFYNEYTKSNDYFDYKVNYDDTITITKYNGIDRDVIIPLYFDQKKVVKIDKGAFKNSLIRSVAIDANEIEIGDEAFENSLLLQNVTGLSITNIGENAFKNNLLLKTIKFQSVDKIKTGAFYNDKRLKTLDINNINETTIDYQAFYKSGLIHYKLQDGLEIYNNVLINVAPNLKSITLSEKYNIKSINSNAFRNSKNTLEELNIDIKDITIDKEIFIDTKIKSLKLHPQLKISKDALYPLQMSLEEIEMPIIGTEFKDIFANGSNNIKKVKIVGTNNVPQSYFQSCFMLEEIYISPTISNIEKNVFECDNLKVLSIPNYEKSLNYYGNFPNLEVLNVLKKDFNYTLVDNYIDGFKYLTAVTFPDNITKTKNNVINNLPALEEVVFPKSIESIDGTLIGENCINLKRVEIPFIGYDILNPMRYSELNKSYEYTREVIVLKGFKMDDETFSIPNNSIEKLTFEGQLTGKLEGSLINLKNIQYLNMKQNKIAYVGSLFTSSVVNDENDQSFWPKDLSTVILNSKKVNK